VLQLSVRHLSIVVILFLIIWLILVILMRKEYLNSFRKAIERRSIDLRGLKTGISDASTIKTLITSLASNNNRQVLYALEMLKSVQNVKLEWPAKSLLGHKSTEVRAKVLELLQIHDLESILPDVRNMFTDQEITIRQEVVHYLCTRTEKDRSETLNSFLRDENKYIRNGAIAYIARYGDFEDADLFDSEFLQSVLDDISDTDVEGKVQLARLLGTIKRSDFFPYLEKLLEDSSSRVVKQAISSLGEIRDLSYIPWLINKLNDKEYRPDARKTLVNYGTEILKMLNDYLMRSDQT
ncbi:MAG: HEAT repeat domain-containing protein, partial [candidate division Zixibacteria bacterium]|nr:HEAT repeat domain-containing protein [candidate division Zixibacteria bacterium]